MNQPEFVTALFGAYNAHDNVAVARLYADGATHDDVALGHPKNGPDEIGSGLAYFLSRFPDAHWDLEGHVEGPAFSAGWYRLTGTLHADLGSTTARGQELDLRGVQVLTHSGGKIVSTRDYWDLQTFERQMSLARA